VLRDEAAAAVAMPVSLANAVLGDIALAAASGAAMAQAQAALEQPYATTRGANAHDAAIAAQAQARADIEAGIAANTASLPATALFMPGDGTAGAGLLDQASTAMGNLARFAVARAHAGRAGVNLANAAT